jgi:hypothetical protein
MYPAIREKRFLQKAAARLFPAMLLMMFVISPLHAEDTAISPHLHPWGTFEPGAWKLVRVVTENIDENGTVSQVSTSDNKTTLIDVDNEGITLEVEAKVQMVGKRFDTEPQEIKQGFHGEPQTNSLKVKAPIDGEVTIDGHKISCQVQEINTFNASSKTTTTIYYSQSIPPYVLKRESITTDLEGKNLLNQTTFTVQELEMPSKILGCLRNTAHVKIVQKTTNGSVVTLAVICHEIPGGTISQTSKELDANGRVVRRTTMELVDFSVEPEKDRSSSHGRKRSSRYRSK